MAVWNTKNIHIISIVASFLKIIIVMIIPSSIALNCDSGNSCIYVSKGNWVEYEAPKVLPTYPVRTTSWKQGNATLFIMIASFRDKLCPKTLFNIYTKSTYPQRISVGVVEQNAPGDVDCKLEYCRLMQMNQKFNATETFCPFVSNIRVLKKSAAEAKGPTWGRAWGSTLLRDEEFCMQTDAHMDFVADWDTLMMQMWAETNNEYGILSTYVTDSSALRPDGLVGGKRGVNNLHEVPHLCMVTFEGANGLVRNWGTKCARMMPAPKLTNGIWGAGLSFSKCHAERKVPYDPHTPHIFDGEEFTRAARFWTYGYDIYTPHRVFVVHDYHRSQSDPTHMAWVINEHDRGQSEAQSAKRIRLLHMMPPYNQEVTAEVLAVQRSRYGLGDRRSLDQFINFTGIDTKHLAILENRCGNIDYVPFVEHPFGPDYIPKFDPITEEFADVRDPHSVFYTPDMAASWTAYLQSHQLSVGGLPQANIKGKQSTTLRKPTPAKDAIVTTAPGNSVQTIDIFSYSMPNWRLGLVFVFAVALIITILRRNMRPGKGQLSSSNNRELANSLIKAV